MKTKTKVGGRALATILVFVALYSSAQETEKTLLANPLDDPELPRVLIIGDSISIGYTLAVRDELRGIANVHRVLRENCSYPLNGGSTTRGLALMDQWLGSSSWDLIHFNWGLWDLTIMSDGKRRVPLDQYKVNLERLVQLLEKSRAKLVWASTTPIPEGPLNPPERHAGDEVAYNLVAAQVMKKYRISTNDLHSFASSRLTDLQKPGDVHFTERGYAIIATRVAERIQAELTGLHK